MRTLGIYSVDYFLMWYTAGLIILIMLFIISLCACVLSGFSRVWLFATQWTIAHQALLSMEFSQQEYWNGLPCPPPADHPRDWTCVSCISHCRWIVYLWATGEAIISPVLIYLISRSFFLTTFIQLPYSSPLVTTNVIFFYKFICVIFCIWNIIVPITLCYFLSLCDIVIFSICFKMITSLVMICHHTTWQITYRVYSPLYTFHTYSSFILQLKLVPFQSLSFISSLPPSLLLCQLLNSLNL